MNKERYEIADLLQIMVRLRDPERGCAWDKQQDFASIAPYTIEEAYEVADAIDRQDMGDLKDELGDLLLQVVYHAQMASEEGAFVFEDVVGSICRKMLRRHPHVFAETPEASVSWDVLKKQERAAVGEQDSSALAGIARGLPEWQRAIKLQSRAARSGFEWVDAFAALTKLQEEVGELGKELSGMPENKVRLGEELGDVLFACTGVARMAGLDVGTALRQANRKFEQRFREMESLIEKQEARLELLSLQEKQGCWDKAKQQVG